MNLVKPNLVSSLLCLAFVASCQDSGFSGGGSKKDTTPKTPASAEAVPKKSSSDDTEATDTGKTADDTQVDKKASNTETAVVDTTPKPHKDGCQVFISGRVLSNVTAENISRIYTLDDASEWVGSGSYASNASTFPNANKWTFDGIALDRGTHMVIYSQENFKGAKLLDRKGPLVLNNIRIQNSFPQFLTSVNKNWDDALQSKFPQSVREISDSDMTQWGLKGSTVITCD